MRLCLLLSMLLVFSCAGPTNPFGGDILISENFQISQLASRSISDENIQISLSPDKQYYNSPYDLSIKINDPNFDLKRFRYELVYNHKKINRWLKTEEIHLPKKPSDPVEIRFKNLSLLPGNMNQISFLYYPTGSTHPLVHKLEVPQCLKELAATQLNISPFKVSNSIKDNIQQIAKKYTYNPSLIAALIAQESSFNIHALSVAKALGLTQITPLAHREIAQVKPAWKIYPKFNQLTYPMLKYHLSTNAMNPKNEWRLDPEKSIEGGVIYLEYLENYWSSPEKSQLLKQTFNDVIPMTDILLASYNSGAYRVKTAIQSKGKEWLLAKELLEARKYVMNIKSYCYAFNPGE